MAGRANGSLRDTTIMSVTGGALEARQFQQHVVIRKPGGGVGPLPEPAPPVPWSFSTPTTGLARWFTDSSRRYCRVKHCGMKSRDA
jgi:hypothetical protein